LTRATAVGTMRAVPALADDAIARIAAVRTEIAAAARRAGRDPAAVRIIAVVKTLPPAAVVAALDAGIEDVAENYVQEGIRKRAAVGRRATWHLIGGLQRNKVRSALEAFDWVHTVDSSRLALALANAAADAGGRLPVLIQVNLAGSPGQRGVAPDGVEDLARALVGHPALALQGLMTIAPAGAPADVLRDHFRGVRELRDHVARRLGVELPHLSMGMSDDFSLAVEEGATFVRLGRALFGPRGSRSWREGA
jgi:PLP dependent protein